MAGIAYFSEQSIGGDEYYTLLPDAEIIADNLIDLPLKVWCPFNDTNSVWRGVLEKRGFEVVTTDTDFFETPPRRVCKP